MSVSIVLVPMAIAAISAWQASKSGIDTQGRSTCEVSTRMRNESLLAAALTDTHAHVRRSGPVLHAEWPAVRAEFSRDHSGIWQANFTGDITEAQAIDTIRQIDQAYGLHVQRAVVERLKRQAPSAGMAVVSERVEADSSMTLVLEVGSRA